MFDAPVSRLFVQPVSAHQGRLDCGTRTYRCAIGRGGVRAIKQEGDGATPAGCFALRRLFFRADRLGDFKSRLPTQALRQADGWCDDPEHKLYNKLIDLPFEGRHERLWRDDHLYDLIVVIGYNDSPVISGRGSAIFLHEARFDYSATDGCVALARADLIHVAQALAEDSTIAVIN